MIDEATKLDRLLRDTIPYRMTAVDTLALAVRYAINWADGPPPALEINVAGKVMIEGNLYAFVNPAYEAGLVHCRALLEFLGLAMKAGRLGNIERRRRTDVGIEHFSNAGGHLSMVKPQDVLGRYPGGKEEAEKALLAVFETANKGIAHITDELRDDPDHARLILIASSGVPSLLVSYVYTPLGLPAPDYKLSHRTRAPNTARQ